jgi:hypothetical protein
MKSWLITGLVLTGCVYNAHSQQFIERVYLKDSSWHEGYIIEQVPQQYLKMDRIKLKDTVTILLSNVWKITKSYYKDSVARPKKRDSKTTKPTYTKNLYLELLGNGGLYSFNYDMRTEKGRRDKWGFRVGYERIGISGKDTSTGESSSFKITGVPVALNYLIGKRKGFLELGAGFTYLIFNLNGRTVKPNELDNFDFDTFGFNGAVMIGTFNIGYRHVPYDKGVTYRIALTPLVILNFIIPSVGFSVGYKF